MTRSGVGTGRVTSSVGGIDCGAVCSGEIDYGTRVTLTAQPDAGAVFQTWTGACNGQGRECTLTITQATSTNAVFGLPSGGGGGGGGGSGGGSGGTEGSTPTGVLDAQVGTARAGHSPLGARVVRVELSLGEQATATLVLRRKTKTLQSKRFPGLRRGERVLTLLVPRKVAKGRATLKIELVNAAGARKEARRLVAIPAPKAAKR